MNGTVSIEEYIGKYGSITYKNKGVSMLPLLREGKDLFIEQQTEFSVHCSESPSAKSPMSVNSPSLLKV